MAKANTSRTKRNEGPRLLGKARVRRAGGVVMGGKFYKQGALCPIYEDQIDRVAKMHRYFVWETLPYEVRDKVTRG